MELWFVTAVTCIAALVITYLSLNPKQKSIKWPPGPQYLPIITMITWLRRSFTESQTALRELRSKFGPIVTISSNPSRPVIFIFNRDLAYQALIQKGALFSDRPEPLLIPKIISSNQHTITLAGYGPSWRTLRRNLTSHILHPSRVKDFSLARKWVLDILLDRLKASSNSDSDSGSGSDSGVVRVMDHFRFSMFHLLVVMCFGDKMGESQIKEIESVLQELLTSLLTRFRVLNLRQAWLTRVLFRKRWNEFYNLKKKQEEVLIPYIRARQQQQQQQQQNAETVSDEKGESTTLSTCYVDSLVALEIPTSTENSTTSSETRKLTEEELVSLCFEFLNAGTDTTSTTLEWIMANLVKHPNIQSKLFNEIKTVIRKEAEQVQEDELSKMPYLKAVVLEGLRRHPPGHFVLPHGVTQEVELDGYTIPKNASLNFAVGEIGKDSEVWDDPLEFNPERFVGMVMDRGMDHEELDITGFGSREIKMMPFGAGRRICPGRGLALLHLEYFVANLIWKFEWSVVDGNEVDLSEKQEFTIVMKNPLHAHISPRKLF